MLSERERRFVDAYMGRAAGNATKAAEIAGYKPANARQQASRLLTKANIKAAVEERRHAREEQADIDAVRVVKELARIGLSDVRDLFTEDGRLRDIHELSEDAARAVAAVEVVRRRTEGKGVEEYLHKVKLWDKNSALEKIAKHLGMFVETVQHKGEVRIRWQE